MPDVGRYRVKGLSPSFCRSPLYVASPLYVGREALGCSEAGVKFRPRGGVIIALDFEIILWAAVATLAFVGELLSISFFLLFFALGATVALVGQHMVRVAWLILDDESFRVCAPKWAPR